MMSGRRDWLNVFHIIKERNTQLAATLADDSEIVIKEREQQFSDMIAIMASVDNLHEPMATSVIQPQGLAFYLPELEKEGRRRPRIG
jgi:hypothetical protein